jgi:predicted choloylglycine hydrolase
MIYNVKPHIFEKVKLLRKITTASGQILIILQSATQIAVSEKEQLSKDVSKNLT